MILRFNPHWPFNSGPAHNPISAITSAIGGVVGASAANSAAGIINSADTTAAGNTLATTAAVNPTITNAAAAAGTGVVNAAGTAGTNAEGTAAAAGTGAITAATAAGAGVGTATTNANTLLNPYATAGSTASSTLNAGPGVGGQFDTAPTMAQLQIAPNYTFQLNQGENALARNAAALGSVGSGSQAKSLGDYVEGDASSAYQQAFNNYETS